ncbi:MAG: formate/nitrite transporter family protein [Janthinobacterium lividum]
MAEDQGTAVAEKEEPQDTAPEPDEESGDESAQKDLARPSAEQIYRQVARNAKEELKRSSVSLAISGFTGGTFMGFSALGVGIVLAALGEGPGAVLLSRLLYPLGFIVVILGRSQLFTENTLYPVALVLAEKKQLWNTLRLWAVVLPSNLIGALAFAALVSLTHGLSPEIVQAIAKLGMTAAHPAMGTIFWSAVMGGWIIATAAWLVSGSHSISGSILLIWLLTFVVGAGNFAHSIATSAEILTAVLTRQLPIAQYFRWLLPAVGGNICGGVLMVTLLEYGQAIYGTAIEPEVEAGRRQ